MWIADVKPGWFSQRALSRFDIREKLFVGEQMPHSSSFVLVPWIYRNYPQQSKAAFELKNQIVTGGESLGHNFQKVSASKPDA